MPTKVTCHACGYGWEYSGDKHKATCPSCHTKTHKDGEAA